MSEQRYGTPAVQSAERNGQPSAQPDPELDHSGITGQYLRELAERALRIDTGAVAAVTEHVMGALRAGSAVLVAGNGGSAAAATHIACDWLAMCREGRFPHATIVSLADNAATITAIANDIGFTRIFARQIEIMGTAGDLLLLLSVSGNSLDIVEAARTARERGLRVVGLFGNAGSAVAHCHAWAEFGDGDYGHTEDLHLAVNHIMVRILNNGQPRVYHEPITSAVPESI